LRYAKRGAHIQIYHEIERFSIDINEGLRPIAAGIINQDTQSIYGRDLRNEAVTRHIGRQCLDKTCTARTKLGKIVFRSCDSDY
jgi:hypothetical protein